MALFGGGDPCRRGGAAAGWMEEVYEFLFGFGLVGVVGLVKCIMLGSIGKDTCTRRLRNREAP